MRKATKPGCWNCTPQPIAAPAWRARMAVPASAQNETRMPAVVARAPMRIVRVDFPEACTRPKSLSDRIGSTHGMPLRMKPPSSASSRIAGRERAGAGLVGLGRGRSRPTSRGRRRSPGSGGRGLVRLGRLWREPGGRLGEVLGGRRHAAGPDLQVDRGAGLDRRQALAVVAGLVAQVQDEPHRAGRRPTAAPSAAPGRARALRARRARPRRRRTCTCAARDSRSRPRRPARPRASRPRGSSESGSRRSERGPGGASRRRSPAGPPPGSAPPAGRPCGPRRPTGRPSRAGPGRRRRRTGRGPRRRPPSPPGRESERREPAEALRRALQEHSAVESDFRAE